jgi:hypothetical protein
MKRRMFALVGLTLLAMATSTGEAAAATATTYSISQATTTPEFQCTDVSCGTTVSGYTYTGDGTCQTNCSAYPPSPIRATLTFSVTRTYRSDTCKMRRGTGTLDASWPSDPQNPSVQGTFTFRSRGGKVVHLSGEITSSTVPGLFPPAPIRGSVAFPPSPCVGGTASAEVRFVT